MPSFETLDMIADSYTPLLLIIVLLNFIYTIKKKSEVVKFHGVILLGGVVITYGIMFLDNLLHLWPVLGLDYSTHTAAALSLVIYLIVSYKVLWIIWSTSLVCYIVLMIYQEYHTLMDIVSTAFVVGGLLWIVIVCLNRRETVKPI